MRSSRRILLLALGAVSAAASLLIAEWVWRRVVHSNHQRALAAFAVPLYQLAPGEAFLYGLAPGIDSLHHISDPATGKSIEVHYKTNAEALRVHPIWPGPDGIARVLFVGDSHTFGTAVDDGVAFPHQVGPALRVLGKEAFPLNAGVPGYNSEQTLARLPGLLDRFSPAVVVLGYVMNDAEPPVTVPLPPDLVYQGCRSWLFEDGKSLLNGLAVLAVDDRPVWTSHKPVYDFDYRRGFRPGQKKGERSCAAVAAMHSLCRARGVRFAVAILPDFTCPWDHRYRFAPIHERIAALGRAEGFPTIDLLTALRPADPATLRVPGDGHPNAEGHGRIATAIAPWLAELLHD